LLNQSREAPWAVELVRFSKVYRPDWMRRPWVAVNDLSLRIGKGQVLGLLGPNGSGKSTTLKAIAGLLQPTAGACQVHGHESGSAGARRLVGYLPESPRFSPHLTAREFLGYCAGLSGTHPDRIETVLTWSGLLAVADRRLASYSKGMLQRIGLAQAIVAKPAVLLLDEPASGLDPAARLEFARLIRELRAEGVTIVFTSHLLTQAAELCDRIAILGGGRLLEFGAPEALLGRSGEVAASRLEQLYLEKTHDHA
jgi:ABC-2 type transport system ATP-binding protein